MADDLAYPQPVSPLPQDEELTEAELHQLDLIASLRAPVALGDYRQRLLLRRHQAGSSVSGNDLSPLMAYLLLSWDEVLRLRLMQLEAAETIYEQMLALPDAERDRQQTSDLQQWIEELSNVVSQFERKAWEQVSPDAGPPPTAAVRLEFAASSSSAAPAGGLLGRVSRLFGSREEAEKPPTVAPIELFEGDLIDPAALAAYASAAEFRATFLSDCQVLQVPRELYLTICRDPGFRQSREAASRAQVIETRLRQTPLFTDLEPKAMQKLVERVELVTADAGAVVCDENEPADAAYVVLGGVVEVFHGRSALLHPQDVTDWTGLCRALAGNAPPSTN